MGQQEVGPVSEVLCCFTISLAADLEMEKMEAMVSLMLEVSESNISHLWPLSPPAAQLSGPMRMISAWGEAYR